MLEEKELSDTELAQVCGAVGVHHWGFGHGFGFGFGGLGFGAPFGYGYPQVVLAQQPAQVVVAEPQPVEQPQTQLYALVPVQG